MGVIKSKKVLVSFLQIRTLTRIPFLIIQKLKFMQSIFLDLSDSLKLQEELLAESKSLSSSSD